MDPKQIIDQGRDDFILNLAILKRVTNDSIEEKKAELEALSKMIAGELAQILVKLF